MVQNTLNLANIVACVAAAAGVPGAGGVMTAISGTLSGTAVWRDLTGPERTRAQGMAEAFDLHLTRTHLTVDRKKITAQVFARFPPGLEDMAQGNMDAERIAEAMRDKVAETATDPAYTTRQALDDYATALRVVLPPLLAPRDPMEAMQQEMLRRTQVTGAAQRLAEAGVTEGALLGLVQRLAGSIADVEQAWTELQNLVEIHLRLQREGHTPSNHGDFVDAVLASVAALAAEGDYAGAGDAIARALAEEDAAHRARKSRLLDSAAEIAMLQSDAATAADYLIRKADLDAGGRASFEGLRALQDSYHETGRDKGTALDLEIAVALARRVHDRAGTNDERGAALNYLAISLSILGERESGPARLEEAVAAYRAALEELPRDRVPLDWAMAQMNLGGALKTLGERESGTARLEEALAACRAALKELTSDRVPLQWAMAKANLGGALLRLGERESGTGRLAEAVAALRAVLEVWTRDHVPLDWARTQQNLGNTLTTLGARESGTERLEAAVAAFRAALEETPRDRVPMDWAMTQQNLGGALLRLGERESGTARLEAAVAAFRAALEEWTRDRVPLQWAMIQGNLSIVEMAFFDKTSDARRLDRAEGHAEAAREVFVAAQASQYIGMIDANLAAIAARRGE